VRKLFLLVVLFFVTNIVRAQQPTSVSGNQLPQQPPSGQTQVTPANPHTARTPQTA
jgi:hypothetical protein